MKDAWDKFKISSDALKANWPIILICLTGLSSAATNMGQYFTNQDLEASKVKAVRDVAIGFQAAMVEIEPKAVVVKSTCNPCGNYLIRHEKEYH